MLSPPPCLWRKKVDVLETYYCIYHGPSPAFPTARERAMKPAPSPHLPNLCARQLTSAGQSLKRRPVAEIASDSRSYKPAKLTHTDTALRSATAAAAAS